MVELTIVTLIVFQLYAYGELSIGYVGRNAYVVVTSYGSHIGFVAVGKERGSRMNDITAGAHGKAILAVGQTRQLLTDGAIGKIARTLPLVEVAASHFGWQVIAKFTFEGIILREYPSYRLLSMEVVVARGIGIGNDI